jgi:hypothetical protein
VDFRRGRHEKIHNRLDLAAVRKDLKDGEEKEWNNGVLE